MIVNLTMKIILITGILFLTMTSNAQTTFPEIRAQSLAGERYTFPEQTAGEIALIVVAFKRQSQPYIDQWVKLWQDHFGSDNRYTFYEIPMLSSGLRIIRGMIDGGMRSGIPPEKQVHTATYYGPLEKYYQALGITDHSLPYYFLLDQQGQIVWRDSGQLTNEAADRLLQKAQSLAHDEK